MEASGCRVRRRARLARVAPDRLVQVVTPGQVGGAFWARPVMVSDSPSAQRHEKFDGKSADHGASCFARSLAREELDPPVTPEVK
jgi:hypothetical protein